MRAVGVGSAARLAVWPDRALGVEMQRPQLVALRAGIVGWLRCAPLRFVARVDLAELNRPIPVASGPLAATVSALTDDLYARWSPAGPASFLIGRGPVVWSKTRQWEESDDPGGAPPFLIDRVAPDRRWGLTFLGDLGAMSYAAGVYEDLDEVEPRPRPEDASAGGWIASAAHLEWTPIGPMRRPATAGAVWPMPSPRSDPWYTTPRASLGLGVLWRVDEGGASRIDVAFSTQSKWRWTALLAEAVITSQGGETVVGGHGGVVLTPIDRLALTGRIEWDPGAGVDGRRALLGGVTWHPTWQKTKDRRNKIGLIGWVRRDVERGTMFDGVVVLLQAVL